MRKNKKFNWQEKIRDFLVEEWPSVAAVIFFLSVVINFLVFY